MKIKTRLVIFDQVLIARKTMPFPILRTLAKLIDGTLIYGSMRMGWSAIAGLVNVVLIARYLDVEAQGFFYTFYSFFQFQAVAQAGSYVALLAALSHAWTRVRLDDHGRVEGSDKDLRYLGGLLRASWNWHVGCAIGFAFVIGPLGHLFFALSNHKAVDWQWPWWAMSLSIAASFLILPDGLALESSGRTSLQQRILLIGTIMSTLVGLIALPLGAGLYTPALSTVARIAFTWPLMRRETHAFRGLPAGPTAWRHDILPQQLRVTLSWLFGFATFQAFVPVAFLASGPQIAGHLGVTLQVYTAVTGVAGFWLTRAQPQMGALAAAQQWRQLHRLTKATGIGATLTATVLSLGAAAVVHLLSYFAPHIATRFGSENTLLLFLAVAIGMQYSSAMVTAVRLSRYEPFYIAVGASALATPALQLYLGGLFGEIGYGYAFALGAGGILAPWQTLLYYRFINARLM